jgi:hypothetical protein
MLHDIPTPRTYLPASIQHPAMTTPDDPLLELLLPRLPAVPPAETSTPYLSRLTSLSLPALKSNEPASLNTTAHTLDLSLQSLASRNHKAIITSSSHLSTLSFSVSALSSSLSDLQAALPDLDKSLATFTNTYNRDTSTHLSLRAENHLLNTNLERILDILHLPSLLQSLISTNSYPAALDTLSHVRRLNSLYPNSPTIASVAADCNALQTTLTAHLLTTLRSPLKLPAAMKTIGFLRRALGANSDERTIRGLFLVSRYQYLVSLLSALQPLSGLPEKYLKRWLEVFREQSFGIVGMYRSIFPGALSTPGNSTPQTGGSAVPVRPSHSRSSSSLSNSLTEEEPDGGPPPDPVVAFEEHLVGLLVEVLRRYLPLVEERGARESLLTQVLYASGSLGRLGGEFAGVLAGMKGVFQDEEEYVEVVKRQKVLASKLEAMGVGRGQ